MIDYQTAVVSDTATIKEAIQAIDRSHLQIALVINSTGKLLGTITDGDIRRGILKGVGMDQPAVQVMNKKPTVGNPDQTREALVALMERKGLRHVPLVDGAGKLQGIELLNNLLGSGPKENWVVIMAGGMGKRMGSLTEHTPKPMLPVRNKPLLESIVENLSQYGFRDIFLSVNYKRDVIQNYFRSGDDHNVGIRYLEEDEPLGTVGSLSLLPQKPASPIVVMNADLVTNINFDRLLEFHEKQKSKATVCIREYDMQVPYGVVKVDDKHNVLMLEEKPTMRHFVNAGIYVLDPEVISLIPPSTRMDMPDLLAKLLQTNQKVGAFPLRENWIDIGQVHDFERANRD